jgi:pyridoxal phosphate-dependent aminotransferase EpsN
VDLYGQCAEYDRIERICADYNIPLIEDAAEALGATYQRKKAGSFGVMAAFSFNGNKIITTSGGGMLVSDKKSLVEKARFLATQARDPAPHYQHSTIGYNYRMSNLLAAVGRSQLEVIDKRVSSRRSVFDRYSAALQGCQGLEFMPEADYGICNRWLSCILIHPQQFGATREDVRIALEKQNIESRPIWKPMHLQPIFKDCPIRDGKVAEEIFEKGLCLPSGSNLSIPDQDRVIEIIITTGKR